MKNNLKGQACKFPHLYPERCHRCREFVQKYFLHTLQCNYVLKPEAMGLIAEKEALLKELHACMEIISNPLSRVYKIKKKDEFRRIGERIREIDRAIEAI